MVLVMKFLAYVDMTDEQHKEMQLCTSYFYRDSQFRKYSNVLHYNHAAVGGYMGGIGWRPCFVTGMLLSLLIGRSIHFSLGKDYGLYTAPTGTAPDKWEEHLNEYVDIANICSKN